MLFPCCSYGGEDDIQLSDDEIVLLRVRVRVMMCKG